MSEIEAFFLGIVQGLTEFLPVSSSGHLLIVQELMGVEQGGLLFALALHIASLGSVLIFYRSRVSTLVIGVLRRRPDDLRYVGKLVLATLPAVVLVLVSGDALEDTYTDPRLAGLCLLVTGCILWSTRANISKASESEPGWSVAFWIGCGQAFAILPGISRSGTTVAVALALGVAPVAAAEFSFLMSAIAIFGAAVRSAPDLAQASGDIAAALSAGSLGALVSGLLAIWLFVRLLRTGGLHRFAYYTWAVGGSFLAWLALRG